MHHLVRGEDPSAPETPATSPRSSVELLTPPRQTIQTPWRTPFYRMDPRTVDASLEHPQQLHTPAVLSQAHSEVDVLYVQRLERVVFLAHRRKATPPPAAAAARPFCGAQPGWPQFSAVMIVQLLYYEAGGQLEMRSIDSTMDHFSLHCVRGFPLAQETANVGALATSSRKWVSVDSVAFTML